MGREERGPSEGFCHHAAGREFGPHCYGEQPHHCRCCAGSCEQCDPSALPESSHGLAASLPSPAAGLGPLDSGTAEATDSLAGRPASSPGAPPDVAWRCRRCTLYNAAEDVPCLACGDYAFSEWQGRRRSDYQPERVPRLWDRKYQPDVLLSQRERAAGPRLPSQPEACEQGNREQRDAERS